MSELPRARLAMLVASMRAGGARVGIGELLAAHRALRGLDPTNHETAYLALRASLCSRDDDLAPFDAAFAEWFATPTLLQDKDFAEYSEAERRAARAVLRRLAGAGPARPSRRTRPARRRGPRPLAARPDLRRTIRASLRTGGDPFERHWDEAGDRPRPLMLVCDAAGSMEPYARMLLQYARACLAARRPAEAFVFGTRAASDLSGATGMGEALAALNREHGRRVGRGAIVVLLSDDWDRDDPEELSVEMARLRGRAHSLVWLNPHPHGMPPALPHVDHFLAGSSLASLEELAHLIDDGLE